MPPPERQAGIVGKTNVGKSTFFAAATLATVDIGNRPFVTLEPSTGVGYVRKRCVHVELGLPRCEPATGYCINGWRFIPVKLIDIPGLIPGAHQGKGLGNRFLDAIRRADAIILVVDASGSTDAAGNPVPPGTYDPVEEVRWLERELDEWIYGILLDGWDRFAMKVSTTGVSVVEALAQRLSGLSIGRSHVEKALKTSGLEGKKLTSWTREDLRRFATAVRRSKPMLIAANKADIPEAEDNIRRMRSELRDYIVVPTSAAAELALRRAARAGLIEYVPGDSDFHIVDESRLSEKQLKALEYIRERVLRKWGSTGVQDAINRAFLELLDMIVVYPVEDANKYSDSRGRILPDAYLVPRGTTARELAYMIHTDLGRTFLYAINVKTKIRVGEDYVLQDNDVIKIVAAAAKRG
ncbi:translation-associated GTPase [Pyrodictium occultum]|uniref:Translation-associated GTPase n=1 Tax=Pyrodictium occultum TaxID=2309 RepID=A0A0V8RTN6_PYROC|nr:redox-regulated ATPase YchF [Pyrodictium occultum]KSW11425.1 translation-associated GTPase [Pyrodictium occultum]